MYIFYRILEFNCSFRFHDVLGVAFVMEEYLSLTFFPGIARILLLKQQQRIFLGILSDINLFKSPFIQTGCSNNSDFIMLYAYYFSSDYICGKNFINENKWNVCRYKIFPILPLIFILVILIVIYQRCFEELYSFSHFSC